MPTYYEEHKTERRAYQNAYRDQNIVEVRRKDKMRKRRHKGPDVFLVEHNVRVSITDNHERVSSTQPTASLPPSE